MHGYPTACTYAHGAYLTRIGSVNIYPNARFALTPTGFDIIIGKGSNDAFLQKAQILVNVCKKTIQIQNWIPHQLSRTVKGYVAAAVGFKKACPFFSQGGIIDQ